ncbi:histone H2A deubiquitinase MYSM1-like isoform X2 [Anneissia japonica]|uniref:histone H2A deubiquitinase MYSM1-like isoform X2 n=1 Tax=Anneissia japonica TaxID=1529436 RepID=UPI001425609B|nr:histone H2A deubiquitinase MYSM1-like isoform X2 [Anneissia japonica]
MNSNMPQWVLHDDIDHKSRSTIEKMLLEEHLYSGKRVHTRSGHSKNNQLFRKSESSCSVHPDTPKRPWTEEETNMFNHGREIHGNKWTKIADLIPTRTASQVRNYAVRMLRKEVKIVQQNTSLKKQIKVVLPKVKQDQLRVAIASTEGASETCVKLKKSPKRMKITSVACNPPGEVMPGIGTPGKGTHGTENSALKGKSPLKTTPVVQQGEEVKLQNVDSDEDIDVDVEVDSEVDFPGQSGRQPSSQSDHRKYTSDGSTKAFDNIEGLEQANRLGINSSYFGMKNSINDSVHDINKSILNNVHVKVVKVNLDSGTSVTDIIKQEHHTNDILTSRKASPKGEEIPFKQMRLCLEKLPPQCSKSKRSGVSDSENRQSENLEDTGLNQMDQTTVINKCISKQSDNVQQDSKNCKSDERDDTGLNQTDQASFINKCISKQSDNDQQDSKNCKPGELDDTGLNQTDQAFFINKCILKPPDNDEQHSIEKKHIDSHVVPKVSRSLDQDNFVEASEETIASESAMNSQRVVDVKEFETSQRDLSRMVKETSDCIDSSFSNTNINSKMSEDHLMKLTEENEKRKEICVNTTKNDHYTQQNDESAESTKRKLIISEGNTVLDNNVKQGKTGVASSNKTEFLHPDNEQQSFETAVDEMTTHEVDITFQAYSSRLGSCKSPERFVHIRNIILNIWETRKPNYVNKFLIRKELEKNRKVGNVNDIGNIHSYLEEAGAINVGLEKPLRYLKPKRCKEVLTEEKKSEMLENRRISMRPKKKKEVDSDVEEKSPIARMCRTQPKQKPKPYDPFKLMACSNFSSSTPAPLKLKVSSKSLVVMDLHAHFSGTEVIGLLGGSYDQHLDLLIIKTAVPCNSLSTGMQCEMDPVSQTEACETIISSGQQVVGWYHSHPTFPPNPSVRDIETQTQFQSWFVQGGAPFIGVIVNPYGRNFQNESEFRFMTMCEQWLDGEMCKQPFQFDFDVVHPLIDRNELITTTISLLRKFKTYNYRIEMLAKYRSKGELTYLEKMLLSIKNCLMLDGGAIQTDLIEKIRDAVITEFNK